MLWHPHLRWGVHSVNLTKPEDIENFHNSNSLKNDAIDFKKLYVKMPSNGYVYLKIECIIQLE
jgi:hypothetical protein